MADSDSVVPRTVPRNPIVSRDEEPLEILACAWDALAPHHARGALLVARPDLDLREAARAVADDRADRVQVWLAVGRLGRPDDALVARWTAASPRFQFAIVQPYVIAQEILAATTGSQ